MKSLYITGVIALFSVLLLLSSQPVTPSLPPQDIDGFITGMQEGQKRMTQIDDTTSARGKHKIIGEAHKDLMNNHPVFYDWWLQDGDSVAWYYQPLSAELDKRLKKLGVNPLPGKDKESIKQGFTDYIAACIKRRETRLNEFIRKNQQVVFTKFKVLRPSFFAYTEGLSDARSECNFFPGGELSTFTMLGVWAKEEKLLTDTGGVFRDPDMHFDGQHLLFSWKKSKKEDDFHLYEMNLSTGEIKQLTHGLGQADIEGVYLPDDNIMFNSTRCGTAVDCWTTEVSNLYICNREGQYMRQVGFDQVHTSNPAVLDDGRVVYTRWDYNDRGQVWTQPLFQMNPDGTMQTEYYGVNSWFPTTVTHVRQIPGTRKIMATILGHHTPQHGKLGIIDPEAGRDENEGVMFVAPLRKPEPERIDRYGQYGDQFQHPFPMDEENFLISYSPIGYHAESPINFGIYWMDVDGERELLIWDESNSCNQPVIAAPREKPFERINTVDYAKEDGIYYMQDIYEGNGLDGVNKGDIKKLRVVEIEFRAASIGQAYGYDKGGGGHSGSPVGVGNASWDVKKVLGTVDVYPDGSAFFKVPARKPLYFQALDENNRVVQTMRSWSTLQPGETQSCVGCHEHKNTVPVASHPVSLAMDKGIQNLTPEDNEGIRTFSFIKEIQPILDANCVSCHDGRKHKMSLKGELKVVDEQTKRKFPDSYLSLTHAKKTNEYNDSWQGDAHHPEVNWISSLSEPTILPPYSAGSNKSNLISRLEKGHKGVQLTKEEISKFALWMDLLVPLIGDYREANNWSEEEKEFYTYYETKREEAAKQEQENIRQYLQSLSQK